MPYGMADKRNEAVSVCLLAFVVVTATRVSPAGSSTGAAKTATDPSLQRRLEAFVREKCPVVRHHVWASLDSKLVGNGYHQQLVREVHVNLASAGGGGHNKRRGGEMEGELGERDNLPALIVVENITRDVYVDLDQIAALEPFGGPKVVASSYVNTELPSSSFSSSDYHLVLVYSDLILSSASDSGGMVVARHSLPFHFRYQPPSLAPYDDLPQPQEQHQEASSFPSPLPPLPPPGYTQVSVLPPPCVLVRCDILDQANASVCGEDSLMLPCHWPSSTSPSDECQWTCVRLQEKVGPDHASLLSTIPHGQLSHLWPVTVLTVLTTLLGTLVLTYTISHKS